MKKFSRVFQVLFPLKMIKKIFLKIKKTKSFQNIIAYIGSLYINFIYKTNTWIFHNIENVESFLEKNQSGIFVFWHGNLMMMRKAWRFQKPFFMLISRHSDGQLIAKIMDFLAIDTIFMDKKDPQKGFLQLKSILNKGFPIGMTPDGPKGPPFQAKKGVFLLSFITQRPVFPVSFSTSRHIKLKTWDKFLLPLPFGQGSFVAGQAIPPPQNDSPEECARFLKKVTEALQKTSEKAEELCSKTQKNS